LFPFVVTASYTGSSSEEEDDINPRDKQQVSASKTTVNYDLFMRHR